MSPALTLKTHLLTHWSWSQGRRDYFNALSHHLQRLGCGLHWKTLMLPKASSYARISKHTHTTEPCYSASRKAVGSLSIMLRRKTFAGDGATVVTTVTALIKFPAPFPKCRVTEKMACNLCLHRWCQDVPHITSRMWIQPSAWQIWAPLFGTFWDSFPRPLNIFILQLVDSLIWNLWYRELTVSLRHLGYMEPHSCWSFCHSCPPCPGTPNFKQVTNLLR